MSELHQRLSSARAQVVSRWNPQRADAAWAGVRRRQQRARQRVWIGGGALLTLMLLAVIAVWQRPETAPGAAPQAVVPNREAPLLVLDDGSEVTRLSADTRLSEVERGPHAIRLRLEQGAAKFRVTRRPERVFEVLTADVSVRVLGTAFSVERRDDSVVVSVERGRVAVAWPGNAIELGPGEQHIVPQDGDVDGQEMAEPLPAPTSSAIRRTPPPRVTRPDWRQLARDGKHREAYDALVATGSPGVRNEPGDLLLAADVTRLAGHPAESVEWLQRVVSGHPGDSRAGLAAFTLGRLYLDQLGSPEQAVPAFARARAMGGELAVDALAREVEARSRAGDAAGARRLAEEYLAQYPNGARAAIVRRYGGLDDHK